MRQEIAPMWPCIETEALACNSEKSKAKKESLVTLQHGRFSFIWSGKKNKENNIHAPLPECQGLSTQRAKSQANTELEQFSHLR